jgi:tetratricopeptide (TPR) repeat protein
MKVFVLMPFAEEFDDVYHIIKDATESVRKASNASIECYRADEIDEPGKISVQVLDAIRSADLVVAELTGSNPNVMYELGFAHALNKPAIILNQAVHNSPFDVKDFRQITYDRTRLLKDCRPSLIASITSVVQRQGQSITTDAQPTVSSEISISPANPSLRPGPALTKEVQKIQLELRFLKNTNDKDGAAKQAAQLLDILGRISVVGYGDSSSLRNAIGSAGNCAVILEQFDLQDSAEKIYRKAIGILPDYEGVHIQYADLLADLERMDEAREELHKARSIAPQDPRIGPIETKIAIGSGQISGDLARRLKDDFYANPSDDRRAAAYLLALSQERNTPEFERAAKAWSEATGDNYAPMRSFADYLASSRVDEDMQRAVEIYTQLVATCPKEQLAPMLHNLATLLYHFDRDEEAEAKWRIAYRLDPSNFSIQGAFSQLLDRKGDLVSARLVARAQPLTGDASQETPTK